MYIKLFKSSVIILLILILCVLIFEIKIEAKYYLEFCALMISVITFIFSIFTHFYIVNRDKKINTISELSRIRAKYPYLASPKIAGCKTNSELVKKRTAYLKEMEFFCTGINEDIYDLEIVKRMSGHFLAKQYNDYMRRFVCRKADKTFEYVEYLKVMENLYNYYKMKGDLK